MAATPSGKGYWLVGSDGGVFAYGDAAFYGSMGDKVINGWIVGISSTKNGKGYYLQGSDGAIYAFGDATYQGGLFFPPPSISLTSNPTPVWSGSPETISWNVANAAGATIYLSGDGVLNNYGAVDSATVTPHNLGLSTYTLTVIGAGGTDNLPFQINVVVPPPVVHIYSQSNVITWNIENAINGDLTITGPKGETVYGPQNQSAQGVYVFNGSPGSYTATLTASNSTQGSSSSTTFTINASPPLASHAVSSDPGVASCTPWHPPCAIVGQQTGDCKIWYASQGGSLNSKPNSVNYTSNDRGKKTLNECKDQYSKASKIYDNKTKDHYQWNGKNYK